MPQRSREREFDVVLYGATGFTGRLIARQLEKHHLNFAVAGRDEARLRQLSASLKSCPPTVAVSAEDEAGLVALARRGRVLASAAGPFALVGLPVVRAAVKAGAHYLDTTGEQHFVRQVAAQLDTPARNAGVAVAPAMGFDVVPGDLAAWQAAQALAQGGKAPWLARVDIVYKNPPGTITRGTLKSMLGVMAETGFVWRAGRYADMHTAQEAMDFTFPGGDKKRRAVLAPMAEAVTVPRSVKADEANVWLLMRPGNERLARLSKNLGGLLLGTPLGEMVARGVALLPEGPTEEERKNARFEILARAEARDGRVAQAVASGSDPYGLTAELIAVYASLMARPSFHKRGVLSPSQVAPPRRGPQTAPRPPRGPAGGVAAARRQ